MNRQQLAQDLQQLGESLNTVRAKLGEANTFPFIMGMIRAAEEILLVVVTTLNDPSIPENLL